MCGRNRRWGVDVFPSYFHQKWNSSIQFGVVLTQKMAQLLKLKSLDSWDFTFEKNRKFTLNPKIIQWEFTLEKNDKAGSLVTWLKRLGLYMAAYASACIEVKSFAFNAYVVSIKSQTSVYQIQGSAKDKQNAINVHPKIFNFLRKFQNQQKKDESIFSSADSTKAMSWICQKLLIRLLSIQPMIPFPTLVLFRSNFISDLIWLMNYKSITYES